MLSRLPDGFTALVTGASGGIGHAVVNALLESDRPGRVIGVSRAGHSHPDPRFESLALDISETQGLAALEHALDAAPLHLVFNAIGMLHDDELGIGPEKKLDDLDAEALSRLYHVNAITPALLLKALQPSLKGRHPALVASLSARVGSIGDNRLGGWYAYRASKAAHNMLMKTAAVELRRLNPEACVASLHPGTTDTALSKPFQARVPDDKLFTARFVAERLLTVLDDCGPEQSGTFLDWAGEAVEW
ncbi:NAD(P)-dependent dehydrogenase (short-subunit alcohol dehydrogenase family) [Halomonas fontilapidosi]|uniref:NAD(P)-dependent dehydrogenase (Short-subunit alcohol dehydrogenase family) n=1 Tax=Halomonas fontilapidosi TaxID=616675 RepID=A0A7W5DHS2_9GAMM|nr:SDR family NAD(P)-dependent oxidoreductase [Halomonas fontilapidosi]MBB3183175.1 NAD(P)-dependent dehydrogenase (short-subunit alcohol dehydrogenase family) [Halomonas fontilapidosi]